MTLSASNHFMADTPEQNSEEPAAEEAAAPEAVVEKDVMVEAMAAFEAAPVVTVSGIDAELAALPEYSRSLLQIMVPVRVTLASQRKSIHEIVELGPGSIVKFDKTCDQPLELCIGDRPVAQGQVVKVGDKFGLKISGLVK
jgi:flagellar motor switch/type III secretory pathway protein FliN